MTSLSEMRKRLDAAYYREGALLHPDGMPVHPQEGFPGDRARLPGDSPDSVLMRDGSAIVNPLGKVLAGPCFEGETILTADLDLNEIGRSKFDFDVVGHYSRPDVFQLHVNEMPMHPVTVETK